jgi:hypothetical protein
VSSLIFVSGSAAFLFLTLGSFLQEQATLLPKNSIYLDLARNAQRTQALWAALRSHIPDELELTHRFIANSSITKETAMLMMDAAADFAATNTK